MSGPAGTGAPEGEGGGPPAARAEVRRSRRISLVWLVPLVALAVGAYVAWVALSSRGPEITIAFESAEGLEAGKTRIVYKGVQVGLVESIHLEPDLRGTVAKARIVPDAERYLTDGTRFWKVEARITASQVAGLGTLLSGAYIGVDPVLEGSPRFHFEGLEVAPIVTTDDPGRSFVLHSFDAGSPPVGSPVTYRRVQVGEVVGSRLAPDGDFVEVSVFVRAPWDDLVSTGSRFWNASGVQISLGAEGMKVETASLVSVLIGGIAFDRPTGPRAEPAPDGTVFSLYSSREATQERIYSDKEHFLLYFDQSVRGLAPGAPVELRGLPIGKVTEVKLEYAESRGSFQVPVLIEVEPERIEGVSFDPDKRDQRLDALVSRGLRAQLKTGSLLTGQLLVSFDVFPDAPPARIDWSEPVPVLPTTPTPLEEIAASVTQIAKRLGKVDFEALSQDLRRTLDAATGALENVSRLVDTVDQEMAPTLERTLAAAEQAVASANAMVSAGSPLKEELSRALMEVSDAARAVGLLADEIERDPQSLIFGK